MKIEIGMKMKTGIKGKLKVQIQIPSSVIDEVLLWNHIQIEYLIEICIREELSKFNDFIYLKKNIFNVLACASKAASGLHI